MLDYLNHQNNYNRPEIASICDELSFWSSRFGALLYDNLAITPGIKILDLGCANGFPLFELAHTHGPGCQLYGVDIWREALARAQSKQAVYQRDNISLLAADGAHLPFVADSFDLIVSNLGINNFADLPGTLSEINRVAKPGAQLVLTTNVKGHMQEFYQIFREVLMERQRSDYLDRLAAHEEHRGTLESLSQVLQTAGFNVVRSVTDQFSLRYLDGSAFFRHYFIKLGFLDGWRGVIDRNDEEAIFTELEQRLNQSAKPSVGLKLTVPMLYLEAQKPF